MNNPTAAFDTSRFRVFHKWLHRGWQLEQTGGPKVLQHSVTCDSVDGALARARLLAAGHRCSVTVENGAIRDEIAFGPPRAA